MTLASSPSSLGEANSTQAWVGWELIITMVTDLHLCAPRVPEPISSIEDRGKESI